MFWPIPYEINVWASSDDTNLSALLLTKEAAVDELYQTIQNVLKGGDP